MRGEVQVEAKENQATQAHVVMFSGGVGSWAAARRVADTYGTANLTLLFADTLMEDEDLYRFVDQAAADIGVPLTRIAEGRDVWQVFFDEKIIGNTRVDVCSKLLKRNFMRKWLKTNCDPKTTRIYLGIDWTEIHRFERAQPRWLPWTIAAPMCNQPYVSKDEILAALTQRGIAPPRLYAMGFAHNNCGGFCIKAGQGSFINLLEKMPERYAYHEQKEQEFRGQFNKNVAILRDRTGGKTRPLTLLELRKRVECGADVDREDIGGCGCAVD